MPTSIIGPLSLELLPCSAEMDYIKKKRVVQFAWTWLSPAVNFFNEQVNQAVVIKFEPTKDWPMINNIIFGDLILTTPAGDVVSMTEMLKQKKYGTLPSPHNFDEFYNEFNATKVIWLQRWNDNEAKGGILKSQTPDSLPLLYMQEIEIKMRRRIDLLDEFYMLNKRAIRKVIAWQKDNIGMMHVVQHYLKSILKKIFRFSRFPTLSTR
jgi:hypothetical protein